MKKNKMGRWWKNHWDEVMLVSSIILSLYFLLTGLGII